jgi:hypothetical protein
MSRPRRFDVNDPESIISAAEKQQRALFQRLGAARAAKDDEMYLALSLALEGQQNIIRMARRQLDAMAQAETDRLRRLHRQGLDRKRSRDDVVRVLRENMIARPGPALRDAMRSRVRRLEGSEEDESSESDEEEETDDEAS